MQPSDTPLYNHPLPDIESWLSSHGCQQDPANLNNWTLERSAWRAELVLDIDSIVVSYHTVGADSRDVQRSFKYSLSRRDLEEVIFAGP
ncbi:DUF3143 domain-containing protein [Romeria aff. gracilis LEGE 07310]|uniref:DUF3143 domain-containing protein n=1 Tax=Vasconcelosia minhoensis LEGE 07310 TaxID=915328 RepID=A0A8J7AIC5_9CYAN|nr:DUF3143 domain-containing protein [Romeria gracilis]MBE9079514.1 DUF3143 domain-containing protein [Romeria aff. gracilis LEGE 07310]